MHKHCRSGLDIQNANTIIIQDVQQFGLAQLYQLLGRVGRADKEAHAHLFYPDKSLLSDQALLDLNINPHLPSEYINYLENPMEIINEAEKTAEKDVWSLMQFTENLRHQYGKEPYSMEVLLKKLYMRRMAADLGIKRIYTSGKMVGTKTNTSKKVFKLVTDSMASDVHQNSLGFKDDQIKEELLLELPRGQLLNWIFQRLVELYASLPALVKY